MKAISHIDKESGRDNPLVQHLRDVKNIALSLAQHNPLFSGKPVIVKALALLHDLGKFSAEFQEYIRSSGGRRGEVNHSSAGALFLHDQHPSPTSEIIAMLIMGHHAGIPDKYGIGATYNNRLERQHEWYSKAMTDEAAAFLQELDFNFESMPIIDDDNPIPFTLAARFLFSILVDADFLATEEFLKPHQSKMRGNFSKLPVLLPKLQRYLSTLPKQEGELNKIRCNVQNSCKWHGENGKKKIYTLTAPTGAGKTLSSLLFAMTHAVKNEKRRVIYVAPFTSIIDQTAGVFSTILGEDNVVEHHSNIVHLDESGEQNKLNYKKKLATENWEAPIVVTTAVQFFETLFAAKPGKCRKLHNIANSVVVLDEAHMIPIQYYEPILKSIDELANTFNVTFLFCTATQPLINADFMDVKLDSEEICGDDPSALSAQLKRVNFNMLPNGENIADNIAAHETALCIVNTKSKCRQLFDEVKAKINADAAVYHLSTNMCAAHRMDCISEIKTRLKKREKTIVISTSLIEAGVDIDFPVLFREGAGIDSISQAAGRCNREGLLAGNGEVHVFPPNTGQLWGNLKQGWECTSALIIDLEKYKANEMLLPECIKTYFNMFYRSAGGMDEKGIIAHLSDLDFRTVAEKMKLIEDNSIDVVVPYSSAMQLISKLDDERAENWKVIRQLQRYAVGVRENVYNTMKKDNTIIDRAGVSVLNAKELYNNRVGIDFSPNRL